MTKLLVTHLNPHLDDAAAFWLLRRFHPDFHDAKEAFIQLGKGPVTLDGKPVDSDPNVVHVGVGGGLFDEHKGLVGDCATTLVWKWLLGNGYGPKNDVDRQAIQKLVDFVYKDDTGQVKNAPLEVLDFTIGTVVSGANSNSNGDSTKTTALVYEMLDALYPELRERALLDLDWGKRQEFETRFGKTVALETTAGRADSKAYNSGFDLIILVNPVKGYRQFRAKAGTRIDLTPVFENVRALEPDANWFLHHSKKLCLCGTSATRPDGWSKLSLQQLVDIAKGE